MIKINRTVDYSVYLVTDTDICPRENLIKVCREAIEGGVTPIQLREKNLSSREFYNEAVALKKLCADRNVPLLINDRVDIALAADADGVHLGQSDLPIEAARRVLGENKIIGLSAGRAEEALNAERSGADYLGVGAMFPTATKKDANNVGVGILREIRGLVKIPIVGIGGINTENIEQLYGTGADGVAVVSCIMGSGAPREAAKILREKSRYLGIYE